MSGRLPYHGSVLGRILYWLAVLVISLALLVALVMFLESRDDSSLDAGSRVTKPQVAGYPRLSRDGPRPAKRANTTIRLAAL